MTAIYYDLEFVEDGETIMPLSIGIVDDAGSELYRIVKDPVAIAAAIRHPWLREHVVPHLPVIVTGNYFEWDPEHPGYAAVKLRRYVTDDVQAFIVADHKPKPELWGWYSAYDHVALCQLFGSMVDLPEGIPMFTNDLKQEVQAIGNPRLPDMPDRREHHPLDDARECKYRREWLAEHYLDGKPRWPSMRLIRDVDDFRIQTGEDGTYLACPAVECSAYLLDYDEPLSEVLSKAYEHIDEHKAAGK